MLASENGSRAVVSALLDKGALVDTVDKVSSAAEHGRVTREGDAVCAMRCSLSVRAHVR